MRIGVVLHATATVLALTGCATTFVAERVDPRLVDLSSAAGGIYYALPKTAIDISIPVRVTSTDGGELGSVLAKCTLACAAREDALCHVPGPAAMQFEWQRADVMARARADLSNVYRVTVSPGLWQTVEHEFVLDDLGVLTEGSSSGQNNAGTVATTIAAQAVQLALGLKRFDAPASAPTITANNTWAFSPPPAGGAAEPGASAQKSRSRRPAGQPAAAKTSCDLGAAYPEAWFGPKQQKWNVAGYLGTRTFTNAFDAGSKPVDAKDKPLVCEEVRCIKEAFEQLDDETAALQAAITSTLATIAAGGGNGDAAIAYRDSAQVTVARAQAARLATNAALHMNNTQKTVGLVFRFKEPLEPEPFGATGSGSCTAPNTPVLLQGGTSTMPGPANAWWCAMALTAEGPSDADPATVDAAANQVSKRITVFMRVAPETYKDGAPAPQHAGAENRGYHYRLPATGAVRVLVATAKEDLQTAAQCAKAPGSCEWNQMLSTSMAIAQYGPIVALPSKFQGNTAQLKFTLNSVGALKSIKLGQAARSAGDVTDPLKAVGAAVKDVRDRRAQADKDAADTAKAAPLNALKDQNALAQEQIDKLKKELCVKALQNPPADGSLPAVCG